MKRFLCTVIGLAICSAAVIAFCYALYSLGRVGTCASGGPYVSARPCPAGTAEMAFLIPAAIIGGLIGIVIYSAGNRGDSAVGLGILMWSFTFLGAAGALALAAWGPASVDNGGGVQMAAVIICVIFIPMGIIPLIGAFFSGRSRPKASMTSPGAAASSSAWAGASPNSAASSSFGVSPVTTPTVPLAPRPTAASAKRAAGGGDVVARLERLNTLRESGAITPAEFERLKAQVLTDG